ncbi:ShlB/FhaC/HecB family hemolysin secretion/activation protein [Carnimonas bestiolae]|uniref:ShlB/FhaC/HecB family hemolysin secretion/activation protein n=1 Tax=Carnimonas bestiolae TaxID=3402172 RepID=UPI003EDBB69B
MLLKLLLVLLLGSALSSAAYAQSATSSATQTLIQQRQREALDAAEQQRRSLQSSTDITPHNDAVPDDHYAPCVRISTFHWQDQARIASPSFKKRWQQQYQHQCLSVAQLQHAADEASNQLIAQGLITSRVVLPPQQVGNNTLLLRVEPGRIEAITLDGQHAAGLAMIYPGAVGGVLNLRTLEQGLDQINRLPTQQVTIDIEPGSRPGYSVVALKHRNQTVPLSINASVDNSGQKSIGERQGSIGLTLDSPLGLFDQWSVNAGHDLELRSGTRNQYGAFSMSLPLGAWTFGLNASWVDSRQTLSGEGASWPYREMNRQQQLTADRLLYRDGQQKLSLGGSLQRIAKDSSLAHQQLAVSSPRLTMVSVRVNYATTLAGGYFTVAPSLTQGISGLGAHAPAAEGMPTHRPTLWNLASSYFYPLTSDLSYITYLSLQTTADDLYSSQQLSAGGEYSVRGFKNQYFTGNRGGYWRHQLDWSLSELPAGLGQPVISWALDGGWIDRQHDQFAGGGMLGSALSLALQGRHISQSFTLGTPVLHSADISPDRWITYWRISASL